MPIWILIIVLMVTAGIMFAREPRRLRIGLLLLAMLSLIALTVIARIIGKLSSPTNEAAAWFLLGILAIGLIAVIALASFLIYNGIVMLRREAHRLPNLLGLILGLGLLGFVILGFLALVLNDQILFVLILFSVPPVGYLGFVFVAFLLYAWLYGVWTRRFGGPVATVVVLGAGLVGDRVTPLLASRLDLGRRILDTSRLAGFDTKLVVSGGRGADELVSEAHAMALWLRDAGASPATIMLEDQSTTTEENLRFSIRLRDDQDRHETWAVVTNNFHAFRAATLMSRLDMRGYAIGSATAKYYWPTAIIREFVAILRDHIRLNIAILIILCLPLFAFLVTSLFR